MAHQLQRITADNGSVFYRAPQFHDAGIPHGFSTRIGGVSPAPFGTLNLGNPQPCQSPDPERNISENYARFQTAIGCADHPRLSVHQVHGNRTVLVRRDQALIPGIQADALLGDDPARLLSIRTADCVPILLSTPDGRWVAAIHAGWRGVIADAIPQALQSLVHHAHIAPDALLAAIGPCIGIDAFEVGPQVARAFADHFGADAPLRSGRADRAHVDLRRAVHLQLRSLGLPDDRITTTDRCTHRDADEFFSHRRNAGLTGRHAALIAPAPC